MSRTASAICLLACVLLASAALGSAAPSRGSRLPGLMTSKGPWGPNNGSSLGPRLRAIGLPKLGQEGNRIHTHQHLDVVVNGRGYVIPAGIGIDRRGRFLSALHTHDYSGILHVESPTVRRYTLGQLFDVWGVRFSSRCLGGYCTKGKRRVWVFLSGKLWLGNPRGITLREHQEIVVAYGTYASIPKPIPPTYPFPPGL